MQKRKILAWTAVVAWMAVIFMLSHQPASVSSGMSSEITKVVMDLFKGIFGGSDTEIEAVHTLVRKNAHFIAYFILGCLLLHAIRVDKDLPFKSILLAFGLSILYAVSDEVHQLFIEGRSGEFRDVLIDSAGAATGIAVYWILYRVTEKVKNRKRLSAGHKKFSN